MIPTAHIEPATPSEWLRSATQDRHRRIEQVRPLRRLFAPDYTLDEYRALLARLYGFYAAVEPRQARALDGITEEALRRPSKAALLAQDLAGLGMARSATESLAHCADLPDIADARHAVGVCYVLEGASLGGMVIRKRLTEHFGSGIDAALRFYTGYGTHTAAVWKAFKTAVDTRFAADPEGVGALIGAANATFDCLTEWLEQMTPSDTG